MFGGEATRLDTATTELLSNTEVLALNSDSSFNHQVSRTTSTVVWVARSNGGSADAPPQTGATYAALFNLDNTTSATVSTSLSALGIKATFCNHVKNVWTGAKQPGINMGVSVQVEPAGVVLLSIDGCK
jgi:hypothetical protein